MKKMMFILGLSLVLISCKGEKAAEAEVVATDSTAVATVADSTVTVAADTTK